MERRILGVYDSGTPGPTLIIQGGIHGNEPAGVHALHQVLAALESDRPPTVGRFVAIAGNLGALARGTRFLDRDLNRLWLRSTIEQLLAQDPTLDCTEDLEQRELIAIYEKFRTEATGPLVFVDLHSSSAEGPPFTCLADTLSNRHVALALPVPMILGLEEAIDGAVMDYFTHRGLVSIAVEGGQHDAPSTIANLEASIWIALVEVGVLARGQVDLEPHRATLRRSANGLPPVVEIRHRQVLSPHDGFQMLPGFTSFQPVKKGQSLARDNHGEIVAKESCRMLLPLYQGQGDDGFFLCRDVSPFWLWVAKCARHLKFDRVAHWLPGVRRAPDDERTLIVNPKIARWYVIEVFHLLGFRRRRSIGGRLTFSRRWTEPAARRQFDV